MARIEDVAAYILLKRGPMTTMKLQKLCFYSHAWHLVWDEQPLFSSRIEAWANGPVAVDLYRRHRGKFTLDITDIGGDPGNLEKHETGTIDAVLGFYGDMSAHQLSELTHSEFPWTEARKRAGLAPMERGDAVITDADMAWYYDGLTTAGA